MFDPLEHPGLPVDRHGRHWRELDIEPVGERPDDPRTGHRIATMEALESASTRFDRQLTERCADVDARRSVGRLGEWAAERHHHLAALHPPPASALQRAVGATEAAFDLVTWVADSEPDEGRSSAYRRRAWEDLQRLRSYAARGDADLQPVPRLDRSMSAPAGQPVSMLYDWAVRAAHRQAEHYAAGLGTPRPHPEPAAGRFKAIGPADWESLVVHETAACYLYYSYFTQETDRRIKPLWELHLQMELAHLQTAADLLRRQEGRDPREVVGAGLPEPHALDDNGRLEGRPSEQAADGRDLLELLSDNHDRIEGLFQRLQDERLSDDERHTDFDKLVKLIAVHEVVEEEVLHPLARKLDPEDPLAAHLVEQESQISEALADAVRAEAANGRAEVSSALRDMVRANAADEERQEFPRIREALPAEELRRLAGAVHLAREATLAQPQAGLPQTAEDVREVLRETSREVRA